MAAQERSQLRHHRRLTVERPLQLLDFVWRESEQPVLHQDCADTISTVIGLPWTALPQSPVADDRGSLIGRGATDAGDRV